MTAPTPCDRLDAYLAGRLTPEEEATYEAHLTTCDACLKEPVLPEDLRTELAAVTCPPRVVTAALRQAHQAPDRAPLAPAPRLRRAAGWAGALAALAVLAALWVRPETSPARTEIAEATASEASADRPTTPLPPPALDRPADSEPPSGEEAAPPPPSSPPPRATSSRTDGPTRPAPPPPAPVPPARVAPVPPAEYVAGAPVAPPDSVTAARDDVLLAFAIVGKAQDRAAGAVADGVGRVSDALHSTPHLLSPHTP